MAMRRVALVVTRALGREQVEVVVGAETHRSLAGSSRYCRQSFVYPSPYQDPEGFVAALVEMSRKYEVDVLFPISLIAMHSIGPERMQFERYTRIPTPRVAVFQLEISDKYRSMRRAVSEGVGIPGTVFVPDGNLEKIIDADHRSSGSGKARVFVGEGRSSVEENQCLLCRISGRPVAVV